MHDGNNTRFGWSCEYKVAFIVRYVYRISLMYNIVILISRIHVSKLWGKIVTVTEIKYHDLHVALTL